MTKTKRRSLAHLCQKRRRKFIVIDDTLMFFLCGERGARLPVLFDCTLPFTFLQPYRADLTSLQSSSKVPIPLQGNRYELFEPPY
jgi:hypothetical protein